LTTARYQLLLIPALETNLMTEDLIPNKRIFKDPVYDYGEQFS